MKRLKKERQSEKVVQKSWNLYEIIFLPRFEKRLMYWKIQRINMDPAWNPHECINLYQRPRNYGQQSGVDISV